MTFDAIAANLRKQSQLAYDSRVRQLRETLRDQISHIRNVRQFPAHYDARYIGGAKSCERNALAHLRAQWANYRAIMASRQASR